MQQACSTRLQVKRFTLRAMTPCSISEISIADRLFAPLEMPLKNFLQFYICFSPLSPQLPPKPRKRKNQGEKKSAKVNNRARKEIPFGHVVGHETILENDTTRCHELFFAHLKELHLTMFPIRATPYVSCAGHYQLVYRGMGTNLHMKSEMAKEFGGKCFRS